MRPSWSGGVTYDRLTAADIERFLHDAGTHMAASAWDWAAETTAGQEHIGRRSPQEWAALYIGMAVETFRRTWHAIRSDTPSARHAWARAVQERSESLLHLLGARPGYDPVDLDRVAPTIMALTNPYERPVALSTTPPENGNVLVPLLLEMMPRHLTSGPYWIHPIEGFAEFFRIGSASSNPPGVAPDSELFPILVEAIRVTMAGLQLLERRAEVIADVTKPLAAVKQETGSRAMIPFALHVGSIYRKLVGERSPLEGGQIRPRRSETRFYQRVALWSADLLNDQEVEMVHLLRSRGTPQGFDTAANDLREAWTSGGGTPRKR